MKKNILLLTCAMLMHHMVWAGNNMRMELLKDSVTRKLFQTMTRIGALSGEVIVMESQTGKLVVRVAMYADSSFVDKLDVETPENEYQSFPVYLALLETGKIEPEDSIDTGVGVYKDVYDHNWRKGGYGKLTLEEGLCFMSSISLYRALENVGGVNLDPYWVDGVDEQLRNLAFVNAVACNGKLLRPSDGKEAVLVKKRVASERNLERMRTAMLNVVKRGLGRKAGSKWMEIAVLHRQTVQEKLDSGNVYDLAMCGFFPADAPKYSMWVYLKKKGFPASSGAQCGPLFKSVAELLMGGMSGD